MLPGGREIHFPPPPRPPTYFLNLRCILGIKYLCAFNKASTYVKWWLQAKKPQIIAAAPTCQKLKVESVHGRTRRGRGHRSVLEGHRPAKIIVTANRRRGHPAEDTHALDRSKDVSVCYLRWREKTEWK
ncbi:hypothetical protein E2C01_025584 [Portunus trituberculatus]|uniref:Uncharacterized protein n=1 Tax=Portunus trituberculatus TaxID=210409 RepID=A0A5B7EFW6_PORTR|nr:hypothetical protein [Portunus trituberculatus]